MLTLLLLMNFAATSGDLGGDAVPDIPYDTLTVETPIAKPTDSRIEILDTIHLEVFDPEVLESGI